MEAAPVGVSVVVEPVMGVVVSVEMVPTSPHDMVGSLANYECLSLRLG